MLDWTIFADILGKYAKVKQIAPDDVLFGSGLDLTSIGFTEFIMEIEEVTDREIDLDSLDSSIKTAGQLHAFLTRPE